MARTNSPTISFRTGTHHPEGLLGDPGGDSDIGLGVAGCGREVATEPRLAQRLCEGVVQVSEAEALGVPTAKPDWTGRAVGVPGPRRAPGSGGPCAGRAAGRADAGRAATRARTAEAGEARGEGQPFRGEAPRHVDAPVDATVRGEAGTREGASREAAPGGSRGACRRSTGGLLGVGAGATGVGAWLGGHRLRGKGDQAGRVERAAGSEAGGSEGLELRQPFDARGGVAGAA